MRMVLKYFFAFLAFLFILACYNSAQAQTVLGKAAASLAPGQWTKITTNNIAVPSQAFASLFYQVSFPGYDGNVAAWNSQKKKFYFESTSDPARVANTNTPLVIYDDATNSWSTGPVPGGSTLDGYHAYDHVAWDDANEVLYYRPGDYGTEHIYRYCVNNNAPAWCVGKGGTWSLLPTGAVAAGGCYQIAVALTYHATMDGGSLLCYDGERGIVQFRESTGTWNFIPGSLVANTGPYNVAMEYSPIKQVSVFGGGGGVGMYKIDNNKVITTLANAPSPLSFGIINHDMVADPTTGDFIAVIGYAASQGRLYRLNPNGSGTWTLLDNNLNTAGKICESYHDNSAGCSGDFYGASISTYGVIMYWKYLTATTGEVWLYKPSPTSGGDVTAPTVSITAPTAGATVSGSAVTLTATASDNVGVVGVQFKVDGVATGSEDTSSPYTISWNSTTASNGSHTITATARDAAGNSTTSTGIAVTVSNSSGSASFATRCAAAGVFFCNGFDTAADLGTESPSGAAPRGYAAWTYGVGGTTCGSTSTGPDDGTQVNGCPTIDTTTKISGAGSMHFHAPAGAIGQRGGQYYANPMADYSKRFGAGQTYYVQFRQRLSASLVTQGQDKLHWVSTAADTASTIFSSCTAIELVNQAFASNDTKYLIQNFYSGCPGPYTFGLLTAVTPGFLSFQNQRTAPGCTYDNAVAGNKFPPKGNCFGYFPDQWVTYSYKIGLGTLGTSGSVGNCYTDTQPPLGFNNCYYNNDIQIRMGLDGQPLEAIHTWTAPINAKDATDMTADLKYGKIIFSIYSNTVPYTGGAVDQWIDELIMSDSFIADPSSTPDTTAPSAPVITNPVPPTTSTTTSPITVSGTATDDVGVTSVTWTCIACVTKGGTATGTSNWFIPTLDLVAGTNTLNVVSHDAAGNASTAATLTITYTPQTTRYASTTGGGTACTVITTPCTLTVALGQLLASETLFLRAGTYTTYLNGDTFNWPSGTPAAPTTIAGYPGETVIIRPVASESIINMSTTTYGAKSYIKFKNLVLDGGVMNSGTQVVGSNGAQANIEFDHITIQNNPDNNGFSVCATCSAWWIHDSTITNLLGGYGIYNTASGLMFEHNTINGCDAYAIHSYNQGHTDVSNNTYRYNTITGCGNNTQYSAGALLASGSNNAFYGNILYNNRRNGLLIDDCANCVVYNNTIDSSDQINGGYSGIWLGNSAAPTNPIIKNNIITGTGSGPNVTIGVAGISGSPTHTNNLCDVAGTWCDTTQAVASIFINAAIADYRLNTGSLALNTGALLVPPYATDIVGVTRPQGAAFDLGAYERLTTVTPVVTIVNPTSNATLSVTSPLFSLSGTSNLP